jgi:hypothetical protein
MKEGNIGPVWISSATLCMVFVQRIRKSAPAASRLCAVFVKISGVRSQSHVSLTYLYFMKIDTVQDAFLPNADLPASFLLPH